jgi:acetolactate synthase I/II/III large subunit
MLNKLRLNGAESLSKALLESGIEVVFGIPGVHNLVLFEALHRAGIRVVATTHEQGAAFMANGYGRATGKPGVFVSVPGPGLTNSLTPVAEALVDSTPMLGIVTDVPQSKHTFQMHEIKQMLLAGPIVKSVEAVTATSDISAAVKNLLSLTTQGEPGPCILQVPSNLYWDKVDGRPAREQKESPAISSQEIEAVVARLKSAKRVGLFVGLGAADAARDVRALVEWMKAPVATTGSGRGVLDESHPLSLGFAWKSGSIESVNRIFAACDLVLAIGVKFSQNSTHDYHLKIPCPLIHVDASPDVFGKNYTAELAVNMDAGNLLKSLLEQKSLLGPRQDDELSELLRAEREICETRLKSDTSTQFFIGSETHSPQHVFGKLRTLLPSNAIVVTDAGYNERLTLQNWLVHEPRTLINPCNFESMGFAIPTAIGAAVAYPDRKVVVVVGDGGLVMSGLEMMTAVRENLSLTVIVLNNSGFGIIKKIQQEFFGASVAVDVGAPDFKSLAESIHMQYQPTEDGIAALEKAVTAAAPTLLEIKMQHREPDKTEQRKQRLKNDLKQGLQKFLP